MPTRWSAPRARDVTRWSCSSQQNMIESAVTPSCRRGQRSCSLRCVMQRAVATAAHEISSALCVKATSTPTAPVAHTRLSIDHVRNVAQRRQYARTYRRLLTASCIFQTANVLNFMLRELSSISRQIALLARRNNEVPHVNVHCKKNKIKKRAELHMSCRNGISRSPSATATISCMKVSRWRKSSTSLRCFGSQSAAARPRQP
jgi:hypothetical protein